MAFLKENVMPFVDVGQKMAQKTRKRVFTRILWNLQLHKPAQFETHEFQIAIIKVLPEAP